MVDKMSRNFSFGLQMIAIAVALLAALELTYLALVVPHQIHKHTPIGAEAFLIILGVFLAFHALMLGGMKLFNRQPPFHNFRRFLAEIYAALVATSLACAVIFVFSVIPFSANYYAWVFIVLITAYLLLYALHKVFADDQSQTVETRSFWTLIFSPWTIVAGVLVLSPGALAVLYKVNRDFSNAVNNLRASVNLTTEGTWQLVDAFPSVSFEQPMNFAFEPDQDNSIIVLSRPGRLFRVRTGTSSSEEVLLDLSEEVRSTDIEMGAYNFALHPEFNQVGSENAGYVYLYYTHEDPEGNQANRLARYDLSLSTQREREASRLLLISQDRKPTDFHNGGGLFFGPDGFLYLSLGDFAMRRKTQRIDQMLISGIFRIDVDQRGGEISAPIARQPQDGETQHYYIPKDNPWFDQENTLQEFWALGFRNPWRMSMDVETGSIWLGDVGGDRYEEYSRVEKGDNGQWPFREGPLETGFKVEDPIIGREVSPVYYYAQTALSRAATGGFVYRGSLHPELQGLYIFADNQAGTVHSLDPEDPMGTVRTIAQGKQFGQLGITSLQADKAGEIYITLLGSKVRRSGEIVRLTDSTNNTPVEETSPVFASLQESVDEKYLSVCSRCHGQDGKGEPDAKMGKERPDFTDPSWQARVDYDHLRKVIVEGGEAVGMSGQMPAWEDFFSEEELNVLIKKIRAFGE